MMTVPKKEMQRVWVSGVLQVVVRTPLLQRRRHCNTLQQNAATCNTLHHTRLLQEWCFQISDPGQLIRVTEEGEV